MATEKRTRRPSPVSVPRNAEFDAALATVMRTGMSQAEAMRVAARFLAHGLRSAWESGAVPDGTMPHRMRVTVQRQDTPQAADQQV
ncbi:hypothetical protein J7F02_16445 [Streptomyces sp. ISL-112]|uniref:hypothetical protein n=1 Tax=unclassified Streptomyces TaxID=2593676 RepID=UPI001BEC2225|nr:MULTISPECIES: hypothetical protein [unclassified Streptomyces]MBT2427216.1 hypothetical protein [Streptomyces sp. ISL-112]MBT2465760.1 hypothetical protein [Streptomyces sp. ISL-63]